MKILKIEKATDVYPTNTLSYEARPPTFVEHVERSLHFDSQVVRFPIEQNRIHVIGDTREKQDKISLQAKSIRPIICKQSLELMRQFLAHKRASSSPPEKAFYEQVESEPILRPSTFNYQTEA